MDLSNTPSIPERLHVLVLTGAGISADSGLPTFRDSNGLWEQHRPEELATPEAWQQSPKLVWRFYQSRRRCLPSVQPNAAHRAIVRLQHALESRGHEFTLVSQNVDNLHRRAGSCPLSMHGQLSELRCEGCGLVSDNMHDLESNTFVSCPTCQHPRMRPNIVWFGEVPMHLDSIENALSRCGHFIAIGTSGSVYPAASFLAAARASGAQTWVNSLHAPDNLDEVDDRFLPGSAIDIVPNQVENWVRDWQLNTDPPTRTVLG